MAKQTNVFGSFITSAPKRKCVRDSVDKYKESWKESAPWPKAPGLNDSAAAAIPNTWLHLVEEPEPGMMCLLCNKYNKNKAPPSGKPIWLDEPCTLFRLQSVHRHAASNIHKDSIQQELAKQRSNEDGGIAMAFQNCWQAEESAISAAMACIYFLAKEEIPHMTKYKPLLDLLSHLGLPFLETLHKGDNATSTSHRIVKEFLTILGDSVRLNLIVKLKRSSCYGMICDETTDLSTSKQLIVYIKAITYDNNAIPSTDTFFLALNELTDGSSDSIVRCLLDIVSQNGLDMSHCTGLGSDGAIAMTGVHNGVSAQFETVTTQFSKCTLCGT